MAIGPAPVSLNGRPRDPAPLGLALRVCVVATIVMTLVLAAIDAFELATAPEVSAPDLAVQVWDVVYVYAPYAMWVAFFLTFVALIWLTYRLARNLHALAPGRFVMSPTYAAGWHLVPIANLFMPPRVTGLIAKNTFALTGDKRRNNAAIGWWWGAFLATALLGNVATSVAADSGAFDPARPRPDQIRGFSHGRSGGLGCQPDRLCVHASRFRSPDASAIDARARLA